MGDLSEAHFTEIYNQYSDDVYRYIFYMIRDPQAAEDLTQDAFVKVYRHLHTFKFKSNIKTWIFKISRNVTLDHLKKKKPATFSDPETLMNFTAHEQKSSIESIIHSEEITALYSSMHNLKKEYREVLILRKINECSVRETASILRWSEDKVKSMTSRALIKLKEDLLHKEANFNESFQ